MEMSNMPSEEECTANLVARLAVQAFTAEYGSGLQTGLPVDEAAELLAKCHAYGRGYRAAFIQLGYGHERE
jgi:hypothetical protein